MLFCNNVDYNFFVLMLVAGICVDLECLCGLALSMLCVCLLYYYGFLYVFTGCVLFGGLFLADCCFTYAWFLGGWLVVICLISCCLVILCVVWLLVMLVIIQVTLFWAGCLVYWCFVCYGVFDCDLLILLVCVDCGFVMFVFCYLWFDWFGCLLLVCGLCHCFAWSTVCLF